MKPPDKFPLVHDLSTFHGTGAAPSDAPWLELLADSTAHSWIYIRELWRVAPRRAHERTVTAPLAEEKTAAWFYAARRSAHAVLLEHLERESPELPAWAIRWPRERIIEGGADVERAYALICPSAGSYASDRN